MGEPVRIELSNGLVFEPDKIDLSLSEEAKEILRVLDDTVFVVDHYADPDADMWHPKYDALIDKLVESMHYGYEHEEFRNHKVQVRYTEDPTDDIKLISFKNLIMNLIFWYPFVCIRDLLPDAIDIRLDDRYFISDRRAMQMSSKFIKQYVDELYIRPYGKYIEIRRLNRIFANMMYHLQCIAINFDKFQGISLSVEAFMYLAKKYPRYNELLHMQLDPSKQPAEIEAETKAASKEQLAIIEDDPGFHIIKSLVRATKIKQLDEVQLVIGLKADQDGKTIPYPINTNFITEGLKDVVQIYINNIAGRKAAIINNEHMGTSGHSLIQVTIASNSVRLSKTTKDCHSANPVALTVRTKKHLEKINGRRYRIGNDPTYHTVDSSKDDNLIGKTIWMRSPMTCACKDGVCQECYGELYHINKNLNSAGAYAAVTVMNPCVQMLLSAKHFQETNSHSINFDNPNFDTFFFVASTEIILNPNTEDIDKYSLVIRQEDFSTTDPDMDNLEDMFTKKSGNKKKKKRDVSDDDDSEYTSDGPDISDMKYFTKKFYVVENLHSKSAKEKAIYEFHDTEEKELYMHDDFINRLSIAQDAEGSYAYIDFENIDPQEFVFAVDIANNELTKPVKAIDRLINNEAHEGCDTIDALVQKMLDLLVDARLDASSVQGEMIMYKLIRSSDNVLKRPNFEDIVKRSDYQILTIKSSLKKDPSVDTALSTPFLRYQLVQDPVTFEKTAPSDYDLAFRPYVSEKELGRPVREEDLQLLLNRS